MRPFPTSEREREREREREGGREEGRERGREGGRERVREREFTEDVDSPVACQQSSFSMVGLLTSTQV